MYTRLYSGALLGIDARLIETQCDVAGGLPGFQIVGLPEKEVSESRDRIRSALKNAGFSFPPRRITANLAPADLRKEGVGLDLPVALSIVAASGQTAVVRDRLLYIGELGLDGAVRAVRGVLAMAVLARESELEGLVVPAANADEAALVGGVAVYPVATLAQAAAILGGGTPEPHTVDASAYLSMGAQDAGGLDLADVRGRVRAKRALEIAAAGGHNLLMVGPPGAGKSLLARCLPEILPPLSLGEALETTRIYSIAGRLEPGRALMTRRPFRAPHQTISYAGMVGGGHGVPGPGEISLAHHGVLFLDELPEFDRSVLETLRQPLEDRSVLLSRAGVSVRYPASFALVCAMNPCPCGFLGDILQTCTCSLRDVQRYRRRLSGPLLDRMDLFVDVPRLSPDELLTRQPSETSAEVRTRVQDAREVQWRRAEQSSIVWENARLDGTELEQHCTLDSESTRLLGRAISRFALSARAHVRILRVARTIADLAQVGRIRPEHIAEAIGFRASRDMLGE